MSAIYRIASKKENEREVTEQEYLAKNFLRNADLFNRITYNQEGRFFHFISNPDQGFSDFEHEFFKNLLPSVAAKEICRYTTYDSIFSTLQYKTYRMGSVIAMNDKGEIDYVDKYIGSYYKPLQSLSLKEMQQLNKSYISSCTTDEKKDDLTMYRLYGEDSKGVCLCFENKVSTTSNYMILKKISYAKGPKNHPELDLITTIITTINNTYSVRFRFLYLDIWKHFFKTHDYAIEDEVRLLYLDNLRYSPKSNGWVITNPDRILSKYVTFDLNDPKFPLTLKKIILGPNFPESYLNKKQLEVLAAELNIKVDIENSKIESYRKS